jgi:Flp pilus assembly pilin Flp
MTAGRWGLLVVAVAVLIVSVVLAVQGSTGLWFTATAMGILIFANLRAGLKEKRRSPDSNR